MKSKSLVIAATLLGGLFTSASALTIDAPSANAAAPDKFEAPVPTSVVSPANLPPSYVGATVNLKFTVDETGQAHDIRVVSDKDRVVAKSLAAAISQWKFSPGRKNGVPVSSNVILPLHLVES